MRITIVALILFFTSNLPAHAGCSKSEICAMLGKMNHFSILDKCPSSGPLLAECKKVKETTAEELAPGEFIDNGNGTVTDTVNKLVWMKTGERDKQGNLNKVKLKIAKKLAAASSAVDVLIGVSPRLQSLGRYLFPSAFLMLEGKRPGSILSLTMDLVTITGLAQPATKSL